MHDANTIVGGGAVGCEKEFSEPHDYHLAVVLG